jgi:hypothetical protein
MFIAQTRWEIHEVLAAIRTMDGAIAYVQRNDPQDHATIDLLAAAELLAICEIENIELTKLTSPREIAVVPREGNTGGHYSR